MLLYLTVCFVPLYLCHLLSHQSPNFSIFCWVKTLVISRMQKLSKEGLQRTDKRIGLMNEILAAMDTVKYDYFVMSSLFHMVLFLTIFLIRLSTDYLTLLKWFRCYAWESSFQAKVQGVRDDELSWFRKASLLGAVCQEYF